MLDTKMIAALLLLVPLSACSGDDPVAATDTCCPIATPSCGCFATGGSGICSSLCDAPPVGWSRSTDENGCPIWEGGPPGGSSCLPGPDTSDADVASLDARETTDLADSDLGPSDVSDVDSDITEPDVELGLRFELAGSIQIVESYSEGFGGVTGSWVYADLHDKVSPSIYRVAAESGACQAWTRTDALCEPACDESQTCSAAAVCESQAQLSDAGDLTITGLVVSPISAEAGQFGYLFSPDPPIDGLFDAGDTITVTAAGGALPAFTTTVRGVADFGLQNEGMVELVDGKDTTLSWKPASQAGSDTVEVVLQLGWHGAPPTGVIVCRTHDSAGTLVIPAAVVAKFPLFGGIGLFQNPSWAERISRSIVTTSAGLVEVTASSRASVGVSHTTE